MACLLPLVVHPLENEKPKVVRPKVDYHPTIWGDHFLSYSHDQMKLDAWSKRAEELKEEVSQRLRSASGLLQELNLIDTIQRLGVGYNFEKEIDESLRRIHNTPTNDIGDDLHAVALRFRLLRQQGYKAPSVDAFIKFKDSKGNFKESLSNDARGLLSLYEAAHLSVHGEDILDEALTFATTHLKRIEKHLSSSLKKQVGRALELPLRRAMYRLEARHYISTYQEDEARDDVLLELAKLDFNLLQSLCQRELKEITRWWNEKDFTTKMPYSRDRVVECYFWMFGVHHEPHNARGRMMLVKIIAMLGMLDDTYDAYGTYEELQQLTNAIQRWDYGAMDQVPEDLRALFQALLDVVAGYEEQMTPEEKSYRIYYAKESIKEDVNAYFAEATWLHEKRMPNFEEYLRVSVRSSGYPLLCTISFVGMGKEATKEAFDWAISIPKLIWDLSLMSRLRDDIESQEFEQKREHIPSCLQVYMNEHGASHQEARQKFQEMISDAWKGINEACLKPTVVPMALVTRLLNLAAMAEVFYLYGDGFSDSRHATKDNITLLFVNPVPL